MEENFHIFQTMALHVGEYWTTLSHYIHCLVENQMYPLNKRISQFQS
jgi:hypothetical protein